MDIGDQFANVETLLDTFPKEARENYYENINTLEIEFNHTFSSKMADYDVYLNKIRLGDERALEHELFHMASVNRRLFDTLIPSIKTRGNYQDGISFYHFVDKGFGLNEGMIESLARRSGATTNGYFFNWYIVDLLISIYGEKLYYFVLTNDPCGFYRSCSRHIHKLRKNLDSYHDMRYDFLKYPESRLFDCLNVILNRMALVIQDIVIEYQLCSNPNITKEALIEQIRSLFTDACLWDPSLLRIQDQLKEQVDAVSDLLLYRSYPIFDKPVKRKSLIKSSKVLDYVKLANL